MTEISAIVCTRNRLAYLQKALHSLVDQSCSTTKYEIIIVDNGSSDGTAEFVKHQSTNCSNLKYVFQPEIGLSSARNTGCRISCGKYLAYMDDDAIASHDWLDKILHAFEMGSNNMGCVGGKIDLIWEKKRPKWLRDSLLPPLGHLNLSGEPTYLSVNEFLYGGNFSIPKNVIEQAGMFDPALGRHGRKLISNEELELQNRLIERGYTRFFDPGILVFHHAKEECLSRRWYLRRMFWHGVSECIEVSKNHFNKRRVFNDILFCFFQTLKKTFRFQDPFESALEISYLTGRIYRFLRMR